jgi:hypothetical protein
MKKTISLMAALAATLATSGAYAGLDLVGATVSDLSINRTPGNILFVKLSGRTFSGQGCGGQNGSWHYTLALTTDLDKDLYAMLLSAHSTGAKLNNGGAGACTEWTGIESLKSVQLTN